MTNREIEERRAANIIWNAARNYGIKPDYEAFDAAGEADLYFNNIIGAVHRYYDYPKLAELLRSFRKRANGALYGDLLWLGLEHCAFQKAREERPVLGELRRDYAQKVLDRGREHTGEELAETLRTAHFQRALGGEPGLGPFEQRLLDAVEFPPELDTDGIIARMRKILNDFFLNQTFQELDDMGGSRVNTAFFRFPGVLRQDSGAIRHLGLAPGADGEETGGEALERRKTRRPLWFQQPDGKRLRAYVERCFGAPMFCPAELAEIEKALCTGNHRDCRLHFTRGVFPQEAPDGESRGIRARGRLQREANLAYFQTHLVQNQNSISRLTERIRNSILIRLEPTQRLCREGALQPRLLWRGLRLHDERVFLKTIESDLGSLTVDILLDGSASQQNRQEKVAAQGYIIAESLTRCHIPVRVSSFCSVSGCTVLRVFRDYGETDKNANIFDYVAAGWNRDGLALRAAGYLMERTKSEHKLLILLSDASPNDDQRVPVREFFRATRDYGGELGVRDVAAEVSRLRRGGAWVMCVFTGGDRELPAARQIYGKDLAWIRSVSWFADTVGRLIQERIREL